MRETWESATYAMAELSNNLLKLSVWLLAFSPYLLIVGAGVFGYMWVKKKSRVPGLNRQIRQLIMRNSFGRSPPRKLFSYYSILR